MIFYGHLTSDILSVHEPEPDSTKWRKHLQRSTCATWGRLAHLLGMRGLVTPMAVMNRHLFSEPTDPFSFNFSLKRM